MALGSSFGREDNLYIVSPLTHAGGFSKHEFQAETKKLLDIVARSLYSEKEVTEKESTA